MSSSDQAALSKFGYAKMKEIDSYHPTVGAVNCDDMARFSDADGGQILIDYNMQVRACLLICMLIESITAQCCSSGELRHGPADVTHR